MLVRNLRSTSTREMLLSAVGNLLQNGFEFTQPDTEVLLSVYAVGDRIRIEIDDHCGGLPFGAERLFLPFTQRGEDRSGLGLGLTICRRSVEANNGVLTVRDITGSGCFFTIDLPRHTLARSRASTGSSLPVKSRPVHARCSITEL